MLIPVILLLTIVNFKVVKPFEAVLENGSLTIVDFHKACEDAGFKIGERDRFEGDNLTVYIESESREIDPLFGVLLDTFCPYVGFYPVKLSSNVNKTEPVTDKRKQVQTPKVNNTIKSSENATASTTEYSTLKDKLSADTSKTKDKLFVSDTVIVSAAVLLKSEPMVNVTDTTPYTLRKTSLTNENVKESPLKIIGENASTDKSVTLSSGVKTMTDNLTKRTDDVFIVKIPMTLDENVTESITSKINIEIQNEAEVVSETEMYSETVYTNVSDNATTLKTSNSFEYEKKTPSIDKQDETVPTDPTDPNKPLTEIAKKTGINYTESEKQDVLNKTDTEIVPYKVMSNNSNTNLLSNYKDSTTLRVERKDKEFNDSEDIVSLTTNVASETFINDDLIVLSSLLPAHKHIIITTTDKIQYATKDDKDISMITEYAAIKDDYLIEVASETSKVSTNIGENDDEDYSDNQDTKLPSSIIVNSTLFNLIEEATETFTRSTTQNDNADEDYVDMEDTEGPDSTIINSTVIYKHDIESMDKRRSVIVFFFVTILLILMAVWTSRSICMRKKGTYVLPQNMDDNIELKDDV